MSGLWKSIAVLLGLAAASQGHVYRHDHSFQPDHILRVTAGTFSEACSERYSVLVNGSLPGPELRLREGETSWIRVYNDMTDANTTIHWHGLTAYTAPFSDGTPAASQWPIPPGRFFDYEVRPEIGSAGTYFYHSHVGFQAMTAKGPLIVESCEAPLYEYDEERTLLITDYFSETDAEIVDGLTSNNFTWSGETEAILVNGYSRPATNATGSCELAAISIDPGKTYRLRFIGGTALSFVSLAIESHEVFIIEADGHDTKPLMTDFLQIASGQRYSVLLKAKSEQELQQLDTRQFYIQMTTLARPEVLTNFAVLNYFSHSQLPDLTTVPSPPPLPVAELVDGWLDYELEPAHDNDFPTLDQVTRRIIIDVHQNVSDHTIWLQNGYDWVQSFPKSPYLVDIYTNKLNLDATYHRALTRGNGFDNITRTFPAKIGEVLEIVWQNRGTVDNGGLDAHPFHAHGRHVYDIGAGDGLYDIAANEERLRRTHPIQRDTSVLYRYRKETDVLAPSGWRAWRVRVTNAGVWMYHCHVLQHMVMGMQTVFTFGDREDILAQSGPVDAGYLTYGGSAYGSETKAPVVQHFKN
ncbi:Cupredoxin [Aspergillus lucknowensis]|uniref:Cupredoxin n=1 Tax=Aspergillus lucknowensis TaxID=176173 RepID=A0ABR4LSI7_9EURO